MSQAEQVTGRGLIFDIEDFAVDDGPGVRTVVFLKGCPLHCRWCANPEGQACEIELMHSAHRCVACFGCAQACPEQGVSADPDGRPQYDREHCERCTLHPCVSACTEQAMRITGRWVQAHEIFEHLRRNSSLYRNSGGGLTLSGGEPLSQTPFVTALLDLCDEVGLSVGVETCGAFDWVEVEPLADRFDFFFFDLKGLDPELHRSATGCGPTSIHRNLERLAKHAAERITVSVPVVPGFTDSEAEIERIADHVRELGITRMRLLPYHAMGSGKYEELGRSYAMRDTPSPKAETMNQLAQVVRDRGIACRLPGDEET